MASRDKLLSHIVPDDIDPAISKLQTHDEIYHDLGSDIVNLTCTC